MKGVVRAVATSPAPPIHEPAMPSQTLLASEAHVHQSIRRTGTTAPRARPTRRVIYSVAFVTGAIIMSFEMLGSRYLNPYFGSGIYTWASLISTVLLALTVGYFLGGYLADRTASPAVLALTVMVGSIYLLALPSFAQPFSNSCWGAWTTFGPAA